MSVIQHNAIFINSLNCFGEWNINAWEILYIEIFCFSLLASFIYSENNFGNKACTFPQQWCRSRMPGNPLCPSSCIINHPHITHGMFILYFGTYFVAPPPQLWNVCCCGRVGVPSLRESSGFIFCMSRKSFAVFKADSRIHLVLKWIFRQTIEWMALDCFWIVFVCLNNFQLPSPRKVAAHRNFLLIQEEVITALMTVIFNP